jgi:hypothetical protein
MTQITLSEQLLQRICCGQPDAMDFLAHYWSPYVHEIDDFMDGDRTDKRDLLKTFARAAMLYSHPFYLKHLTALRAVVLNVTVTYADSVDWEKSNEGWKRDWADHNRHAGMDMVLAVAAICGGYEHAFAISQEQRAICWHEHHDREGKAV